MDNIWNQSYLVNTDSPFGGNAPNYTTNYPMTLKDLESSSSSVSSGSATPRNSQTSLFNSNMSEVSQRDSEQLDMMSLIPNLWNDNQSSRAMQAPFAPQLPQCPPARQTSYTSAKASISSLLSAQTAVQPQASQGANVFGASTQQQLNGGWGSSSVTTSTCSSPLQEPVGQLADEYGLYNTPLASPTRPHYASLTEENLSMLSPNSIVSANTNSPLGSVHSHDHDHDHCHSEQCCHSHSHSSVHELGQHIDEHSSNSSSSSSSSSISSSRNGNNSKHGRKQGKSRTRKSGNAQCQSTKKRDNNLYKTEMCVQFQRHGYCPYGSKCQFAHGRDELKEIKRSDNWKTKPCINWMRTGTCRYGKRCCFKHGDEDNGSLLVNEPPPATVMKKISMKLSQKGYYSSSSN